MSNYPILSEFTEKLKDFSYNLTSKSGEKLLFRPLLSSDIDLLARFLEKLSIETRRLSTFDSYDRNMAHELCDAINKYDKLRYVLINSKEEIIGLIEFTLDIPSDDQKRYSSYGLDLDIEKTCRFGPTIADNYQSQGIGSLLFPYIKIIAKLLGKYHIVLYGGVLADNERAIKYYNKHGFIEAGSFINSDNKETLDMILNIPEPSIIIRNVSNTDQDALEAIKPDINTKTIHQRVGMQSKDKAEFLLMEVSGRPVAFVLLKWFGKPTHPEYPDIEDLYTKADERKKGYASILIQECEKMAKNKGYMKIGLAVDPNSESPAHRLYLKLGFKSCGEPAYIDGIYNGVEDWAIDMIKDLN